MGQSRKLKGGKFKADKRKYLFRQCANRVQSSQPQNTAEVKCLAGFKRRLDLYIDNKKFGLVNGGEQ